MAKTELSVKDAVQKKLRALKFPAFTCRQRVRVVALALLAAALAVGLGLQVYARSFTYVVYLDNKEVGFVSGEEKILNFLASLQEENALSTGLEVQLSQEIRVEKERRRGAVVADSEVKEELRRKIQFEVYAFEIVVNDQPVLAVKTLQEYEKIMDELKASFVSGRENTVVRQIGIRDNVEAVWAAVDPVSIHSADTAAEILKRGTTQRKTYVVSRGDSIWTIARDNKMTVEQVRTANPHLQRTDRLQIGEQLELVVPKPLVVVTVTEDVTEIEPIPFATTHRNDSRMFQGLTRIITPGKAGRQEVVYRIARENGRETGREVLSKKVLEEPRTQEVARGTAVAPVRGTGQFIWPIAGRGRITSRFGPRGRSFHNGLDIGSPAGTPVLAADDGVVIHAGWAGSFGILVTIEHGNGYVTRYAHNSATLVADGQKVKKGQQIARVGSTGRSTGPHLHFEVLRNVRHLNPLNFFKAR